MPEWVYIVLAFFAGSAVGRNAAKPRVFNIYRDGELVLHQMPWRWACWLWCAAHNVNQKRKHLPTYTFVEVR